MSEPLAITPSKIGAGDPVELASLCKQRGGAVFAYCEQVASPGQTIIAAADAFAHFRVTVVSQPDMSGTEADALLHSMTRRAAAWLGVNAVAARDGQADAEICAGRDMELVDHIEDALTDAENEELAQHVADCRICTAALRRLEAGERAYERPPRAALPERVSRELVRALVLAAPVQALGGDSAAVRDETLRVLVEGPAAARPIEVAPPPEPVVEFEPEPEPEPVVEPGPPPRALQVVPEPIAEDEPAADRETPAEAQPVASSEPEPEPPEDLAPVPQSPSGWPETPPVPSGAAPADDWSPAPFTDEPDEPATTEAPLDWPSQWTADDSEPAVAAASQTPDPEPGAPGWDVAGVGALAHEETAVGPVAEGRPLAAAAPPRRPAPGMRGKAAAGRAGGRGAAGGVLARLSEMRGRGQHARYGGRRMPGMPAALTIVAIAAGATGLVLIATSGSNSPTTAVPNTPAGGTATTPAQTKTTAATKTTAPPAAPKHHTPKRVVHKHVTPAAKPHVVTPPPPPPAAVVKPVVPVTPPAVTPPPPPPPPAVKRAPQAPSQPGGKFGSEGET